jgi:hypothetical protein
MKNILLNIVILLEYYCSSWEFNFLSIKLRNIDAVIVKHRKSWRGRNIISPYNIPGVNNSSFYCLIPLAEWYWISHYEW